MPKRSYTQTELWMSHGIVAGGLVGTLLFVFTSSPYWLGLGALGVIVGLQIGQFRDRAGRHASPTGEDDPLPRD